jgi:hypothetical protein
MAARALIPPSDWTAFNTSGGIGDRAQNRERGALLKRIAAGDQAFHVDRRRFRSATEFRLGGGGQNWGIGGRQTLDNNARSAGAQSLRQ